MLPLDSKNTENRIDVDFVVPFRHRLRFTHDFLGDDWPVVEQLFSIDQSQSGSAKCKAKVQVWVDEGIVSVVPNLKGQLTGRLKAIRSIELSSAIGSVPGGEQSKMSDATVDRILNAINRDQLDRRSYVIAIGGGALLDTVGYAAAIAHRGIRLIRFPTTTLAQADSGVGVKNAINAFDKKNWKGTFAVPWGVINDSGLLAHLPDRDFLSGFSEAIKVTLLKDPVAYQQITQDAVKIARRDMPEALKAIRASVLLHLNHITQGGDPFETRQARPLDFGHWSAHKLEALSGYKLRHGEAVAIGVALDVVYSSKVHGLAPEFARQVVHTLKTLKLPIYDKLLATEAIFEGLEEFRQHLGGELTLTMLADVGEPIEVHSINRAMMQQSISELEAFEKS